MRAAKQEADVFPLAAFRLLAENSHRGHRLPTAVPHKGFAPTNSNTTTGFQAFLYDEGRRSRSTGKERDSETGLDYFGARYFSGAEGRFISADWATKPEAVPYADLSDPQTLNLYGYVRNNPMVKEDADGHCNLSADNETCLGAAQFPPPASPPAPLTAQQQSQHLSPIDKVAMKAEAGAIKLTREALAGGHAAEYGGLILSKNADGSLSSTKPIHTGELSVDIDSIPVPKGFTAVGEYHTHPSTTCCESVGPSVQDVNRLRTPELANRIGYVGDAFSGSVSRYTQREPITGPYDTKTYGTIIGTVP
jgi:RHS repeat-associated protein